MQLAIFTKAPRAGTVKTRLIPRLGASGAARLQRQLTLRTLQLALRLPDVSVTLWCAPDCNDRFFRALERRFAVPTLPQQDGDLGSRMAQAFAASGGQTILIGCDCPALTLQHLVKVVDLLDAGADAVFIPAEDGGYVLVALRHPHPGVFEGIAWGSEHVMEQTRARLRALDLNWAEPMTLWDVDHPHDLDRLADLDGGLVRPQYR